MKVSPKLWQNNGDNKMISGKVYVNSEGKYARLIEEKRFNPGKSYRVSWVDDLNLATVVNSCLVLTETVKQELNRNQHLSAVTRTIVEISKGG